LIKKKYFAAADKKRATVPCLAGVDATSGWQCVCFTIKLIFLYNFQLVVAVIVYFTKSFLNEKFKFFS
jgi:hypothetical protein